MSKSLVIRKTSLTKPTHRWSLCIRESGPVETDYHRVAFLSNEEALELESIGVYWPFKPEKLDSSSEHEAVLAKVARLKTLVAQREELRATEVAYERLESTRASRLQDIKKLTDEIRSGYDDLV